MRRRRAPPWWFKVVAATLVPLLILLFAEGLARFAQPLAPTWQGADSGGVVMVGHPSRLWGMGPGARQNAGAIAHISELGLREPLPEVPRPPGRHRLMIVGDSTWFGHGVSDEQTSIALAARQLREAGLDVDSVNGAIPGYSTAQTLMLMEEVGWAREPTLLLIASLWSDNNFDFFRDADLLETRRSFTHNPLHRSALYSTLAGAIDRLRGGEGARVITWTQSSRWSTEGIRRVPPQDYARNLDLLVRQAAERGVGAVLVSPCNMDMAEGELEKEPGWKPYFDAQARVAAHHGVPLISTWQAMQEAARATGGAEHLFVDAMHPSAAGNAIFGAQISQGLLRAGWPQQRLLGRSVPFDPSGVLETVEGGKVPVVNPMSPQANLFPSSPVPSWTAAASDEEKERQERVAATNIDQGAVVERAALQEGWEVLIQSCLSAPASAELLSSDGSRLEVVELRAPGELRLRAPPGQPAVRLLVGGEQHPATPSRPRISLGCSTGPAAPPDPSP